jgi:hypothetical protein
VELDALPPGVLTQMVRESIEECIAGDEWEKARRIEALERKTLAKFVAESCEVRDVLRCAGQAIARAGLFERGSRST